MKEGRGGFCGGSWCSFSRPEEDPEEEKVKVLWCCSRFSQKFKKEEEIRCVYV